MVNYNDFRLWLDTTTEYTKATKSNIISRLRRADKMLPLINEPVYIFMLSQNSEFNSLSVNVKSQLRRSVKIYFEYLESEVNEK